MTTVWVVSESNYHESESIFGVWTGREAAEDWIRHNIDPPEHRPPVDEGLCITEFDLDIPAADLRREVWWPPEWAVETLPAYRNPYQATAEDIASGRAMATSDTILAMTTLPEGSDPLP